MRWGQCELRAYRIVRVNAVQLCLWVNGYPIKDDVSKNSTGKVGAAEIDAGKVGAAEIDAGKVGIIKVSPG